MGGLPPGDVVGKPAAPAAEPRREEARP